MSSEDRIKQDNTSLASFFASIMCRITYEPPVLYQLGLVETMKVLQNNGYLNPTFDLLKQCAAASSQSEFISLISDTSKMKSLSSVSKEINDKLYALEKEIYAEQGIPLPSENAGIDGKEPTSLIQSSSSVDGKTNIQQLKPSALDSIGQPTQPMSPVQDAQAAGASGNKYMSFDKLHPAFQQELSASANGDIMTLYLHSNHDENLYITAIKSINSIIVTFRGTQSIKNALSDANIMPYKNCKAPVVQNAGGWLSSIKSSASSVMKSTEIKEFGGVSLMIDSTINVLMYSILYLSKTFLNKGKADAVPANMFTFGHSLGGGLTTYFAYQYVGAHTILKDDEKNYLSPNIVCISNAAPRVLNKRAMESFMGKVSSGKIKFLRQWTQSDWVPAVPPQTAGYYHPKADGVVTTLKTAQTYSSMKPHKVAYEKSLKGQLNAPTGKSIPSIAAHCFQTYINFWPVVSKFSLGADISSSDAGSSNVAEMAGKKKITIKLVKMGVPESGTTNPIQSVIKVLRQGSIDPTGTPLKAKMDVGVTSYQWYMDNIIAKLQPGIYNYTNEPTEKIPMSPQQAQAYSDVAYKNFATATCLMDTEKSGGKRKSRNTKGGTYVPAFTSVTPEYVKSNFDELVNVPIALEVFKRGEERQAYWLSADDYPVYIKQIVSPDRSIVRYSESDGNVIYYAFTNYDIDRVRLHEIDLREFDVSMMSSEDYEMYIEEMRRQEYQLARERAPTDLSRVDTVMNGGKSKKSKKTKKTRKTRKNKKRNTRRKKGNKKRKTKNKRSKKSRVNKKKKNKK